MPTYTVPGVPSLSSSSTNRENTINVLMPALPATARGLQLQISEASITNQPTTWYPYPQLFSGGETYAAYGLKRNTNYFFRVAAVYGLIDCTSQVVPGTFVSFKTEGDQPVAVFNLYAVGSGINQITLNYNSQYVSPIGIVPTLFLQRSPDAPATEVWTTIATPVLVDGGVVGSYIDTARLIDTSYKYRLVMSIGSGSSNSAVVIGRSWKYVPLPGGEVTFDNPGATFHTIIAPDTLPIADSTHGAADYYVLGWKLKSALSTDPWNYIESEPGVILRWDIATSYEIVNRQPNTAYRYCFFAANSNAVYAAGPIAGIVTEVQDPAFTLQIPVQQSAPKLLPVILPLKNPSNTKITIKAPSWQSTRFNAPSSLQLCRRNLLTLQSDLVVIWDAPGGVYEDIDDHRHKQYEYTIKAINSAGISPSSAVLTVSTLSTTSTIVWKTLTGSVSGIIELVVQTTNAIAVRIEYRGGSLPSLSQRIGVAGEWYLVFDTNSIEWQGAQSFYAIATDAAGMETQPVALVLNFNNSISTDVRWGQIDRSVPVGRYIYSVITQGFITPYYPNIAERMKRIFEFGIISPKVAPLASTLTASVVEQLDKDFATWTKVKLGETSQPSGTKQTDGTFLNKNNTVSLRYSSRPLQKLTKYEISGTVKKVRSSKPDEILVYTTSKLYKLSKDGFVIQKDLSTYTIPAYLDYAIVDDKVQFALATGQLYVLDTTTGDKSFYESPDGETKLLKFVEQLDKDVIQIYTSSTGTTVYRRTPTDLVPLFSLGEETVKLHMRGNVLALVTSSQKVYKAVIGIVSAPATLLYTSTYAIRFVHVEADATIFVGDSQSRLIRVGATTDIVSSNAGFLLNDASLYQGSASSDRVSTVGESDRILVQNPAPSFVLSPNYQFPGATVLFSERMKITKVAGTAGSTVIIGTPDVNDESLMLVVKEGSTQYIARLQRTVASENAYYGVGVQLYFDIIKTALLKGNVN